MSTRLFLILRRSAMTATAVLAAVAVAMPEWPRPALAQTAPQTAPQAAPPAATQPATQPTAAAAPADTDDTPDPLGEDELEVLVARVALYPDELLALVSSASLFPLQIVEASRFLDNRAKNADLKPKESWDGSVISLLNYPDIVKMMADDLDWTQSFGDAVSYQQKDVLVAIQTLRDKAVADGIIKTDDKVKVVQQNDNVIIQAADPEKIYVPKYEPAMLYEPDYAPAPIGYYSEPYPNYWYPTATFFAGAVTGAIFASVVDWDNWGVWGGRFDGDDIDIDCNNCLNNIKGKVNFNDVDWKNVDRSKINFDKNQFANIDRTNIKNRIEANGGTNISARAKAVRQNSAADLKQRSAAVKDIRANKINAGNRPGGAAGNRPNIDRANIDRPNAGNRPNIDRPGGNRPNVDRPDINRSNVKNAAAKIDRPAGKPRPAAKRDTRPKQPSGLGEVRSGKSAKLQSQRGGQAMGGGMKSGQRPHREFQGGGGGRQSMNRGGGGGRPAVHRGGGGRGGGGGGRGGRGGGGRR